MEFLPKTIAEYADKHTEPESELLHDLNRQTHIKVLNPRMLAGHLQGRVLAMLTHMIKPRTILEVGTYTGYSALCFAEGLQEGGKIITIDHNEELEPIQTEYFKKAGISDKIERKVGEALDIIPTLKNRFDLVFLDADKENYGAYYDLCLPMLNKGGYLIADNVLWSGKVLEPDKNPDADTQALAAFNKIVQEDNRVQNVLFPIRDGLMVCRKL